MLFMMFVITMVEVYSLYRFKKDTSPAGATYGNKQTFPETNFGLNVQQPIIGNIPAPSSFGTTPYSGIN